MSFYFDDDNDDNAFSQTFQTSSQKEVTFSQSSVFPLSQLSSHLSPEKHSQSFSERPLFVSPLQQSQKSQQSCLRSPKREDNNNNNNNKPRKPPTFVCQNCGAVDDYYHESSTGGIMTCSNCFTQSQSYGALQGELDYDESQHMAARNRDGTLKRIGNHRSEGKSGINPDGTLRRGRPPIPVEDYDRTKKPPSLEACLTGFQTVLQKSCRILCFELMATTTTAEVRSNHPDSCSVTGDESDRDLTSNHDNNNNNNSNNNNNKEQKRKLYRQVSKTVKDLWKAYLWSWKEGADFYSILYPQIRFVLRDQFLGVGLRRILNHTLAASAENTLAKQVHKEAEEEESPSEEDVDNGSDRDSDSDDDYYARRKSKKIKVEDDRCNGGTVKTEMDDLVDLFDRDGGGATEKIKSENDVGTIVSEEDVPVPVVVLSNNSKTVFRPYRGRERRRPRNRGNACGGNNISSSRDYNNDYEGNDDTDKNHDDTDEIFSVASDLSVFDTAENKSKTMTSRKRKRVIQKENIDANTNNVFAKMIYYHNKLMKKNSKSKKVVMLGRKEAALLLRPSMDLVLGILLVAASPFGVTEGKIVEWVENGSLPILHAFSSLLPKTQQDTLVMVKAFYSLPVATNASILQRFAKAIHVACGYRAPKVNLVTPPSPFRQRPRERILTSKSLSKPGRLVQPSSVPFILLQLVSELGFSQRVLNYSLALIGLSVSRRTLKATAKKEISNVPARLDSIPAPWDSDGTPVFDLNKPGERLRKCRYEDKLRKRRCRERKRKKLGIPLQKRYRNKKYRDNNYIPDSVPSEQPRQAKHDESLGKGESVHKNTEWLPPRLYGARPDKLGDIDQILAVVVIACKLIPDWEKNHQYVFSQGEVPGADKTNSSNAIGIAEGEAIRDFGTSEGESNGGLFKATDRFVPWNQEQFRHIRNGKTESEYLEFLKEGIFRGSNYALPKFVESLNDLSPPSSDGHAASEEDPVKEVEMDKNHRNCDGDKEGNCRKYDNTVVVPNELVLGWKKNRLEECPPTRTKHKSVRVPYRLTTLSHTRGVRTLGAPLGPLIEYIAYKTETRPDCILKHLIEFDKEMGSNGKSRTRTRIVPIGLCYNRLMGDASSSAKKPRTPPPMNIESVRRSLTPAAPTKNPNDWDFVFTQSTPEIDELGRDFVLTQRSPESDDLSSVVSIYAV